MVLINFRGKYLCNAPKNLLTKCTGSGSSVHTGLNFDIYQCEYKTINSFWTCKGDLIELLLCSLIHHTFIH